MPRSSHLDEEEKSHLIHSNSTDSFSVRSFASSSTLSPPSDEEKPLPLLPSEEFLTHQYQKSWRKTPLTPRHLVILALYRIPISVIKVLLPSFLFTTPPRPLHSTSYLDGLRGISALIVFLDHFTLHWYYSLRAGYLSSETDTSILQLPIIRLLFAGRASVCIFFVISGFVLSVKSLSLIRDGKKGMVLDCLSSSLFRRGIRLFLPIMAGTFISAVLAWKECYTPVPSRGELIPPTLPTFQAQMEHWWGAFLDMVFLGWGKGIDGNKAYGMVYNGHLWTIPLEWEGSLVVFLLVLGFSGARNQWVRMGGVGCVAGASLWRGRWDVCCFVAGVGLGEWSLVCGEKKLESLSLLSEEPPEPPRRFQILKLLGNLFLLLLSLYLLSYAGESPSPGYFHTPLIPYTPSIWESLFLGREHFWLTLGSILLLLSLINLPILQNPFNHPFPQYLGDISYSLYICHGMVLFTIGTAMQERWTGMVGEEKWVDNGLGELVEAVVTVQRVGFEVGSWGFFRAWVVTGMVCMGVVFWGSDLFWRGVDRGAVRVGRLVEGWFGGKQRGR